MRHRKPAAANCTDLPAVAASHDARRTIRWGGYFQVQVDDRRLIEFERDARPHDPLVFGHPRFSHFPDSHRWSNTRFQRIAPA